MTSRRQERSAGPELFSYNSVASAGLGFDNLTLVGRCQREPAVQLLHLTSLSAAETFFTPGHRSPLGTVAAGSQSIEIEYFLTYNSGTSAASGDGFGFTYALVDPPLSDVPEPSTWAMMLIGFAGLAFAGYRARVRPAVLKET